jgi:hypothetical protein
MPPEKSQLKGNWAPLLTSIEDTLADFIRCWGEPKTYLWESRTTRGTGPDANTPGYACSAAVSQATALSLATVRRALSGSRILYRPSALYVRSCSATNVPASRKA